MRMASTNAGEFKNLCVEMQKTPVNRGVLSLLKSSKQVQNGLPGVFATVAGFICDDLPATHPERKSLSLAAISPSRMNKRPQRAQRARARKPRTLDRQ